MNQSLFFSLVLSLARIQLIELCIIIRFLRSIKTSLEANFALKWSLRPRCSISESKPHAIFRKNLWIVTKTTFFGLRYEFTLGRSGCLFRRVLGAKL